MRGRGGALRSGAALFALVATLATACSGADPLPKLVQPVGQTHATPASEAAEPVGDLGIAKVAGHDAVGEETGVMSCELPDTPVEALLFATNDANLRERGTQILDDLIACWDAGLLGARHLQLTGFSDPRGSAEDNHALGLARAEAVRRYLVRRGVPADRISIRSVGARDARGHGPETWIFDRRVEITVRPERGQR